MLDDTIKDYLKDYLSKECGKQIANLSDESNIVEVDISSNKQLSDIICDKGVLTDFEGLTLEYAQNNGVLIKDVRIKVSGMDELTKIRELASQHIGRLVKIRGLVNRASEIRPMYISAIFKCRECGDLTPPIPQESNIITQPIKCTGCKNRTFDAVDELSEFIDSQELRIQEMPSDIPSAQVPRNINILIFAKDMIQKARCGDIVEIIGIVKVKAIRERGAHTKYTRHYIEVNNIIRKSKEPEAIELTDDDIKNIENLAKNPKIVDILSESIAPELYGLEEIKEACVYLLFGGVKKKAENFMIRGNINVMIVGDPSTGKSKILEAVATVAPLGLYTSGRGTSAAGLTAAVVRDEDGYFMLEAGIMILADKGIACIDEIDKMRPEDRVAMHEALEQQTVSIHKGDIHQTLNARTAVLAAGNPTLGKYDLMKTVKENLSNLPEPLFSRFDLIFITKDYPQKERDIKMSEHVLDINRRKVEVLSREVVQKYIAYAKRINPTLTSEAKKCVNDYYVKIRSSIADGAIGITLRQLESLVRISEAHARIRLSKEANTLDAEAAIKLFNKSIEEVGIEQREGNDPKTKDGKFGIILSILIKETERNELYVKLNKEYGISTLDAGKLINELIMTGRIMEPREGYFVRVV